MLSKTIQMISNMYSKPNLNILFKEFDQFYEFLQVLLKEHKDSIQKLSMEYARLQKENENLRKIIASAKEALGGIEIVNKDDEVTSDQAPKKKKYGLTLECRDCLSGWVFFDTSISRKITVQLMLFRCWYGSLELWHF